MEEKKRRQKLDYDLSLNYDNLMVRKDMLKVEQDAIKIASNRKVKMQMTSENRAI